MDVAGSHGHDIDELMLKLESELSVIETAEIVQGFTEEELDAKGFIGDKSIAIERSSFANDRKEQGYVFAQDIQYAVMNGYKSVDEIPFDEVESLNDVSAGDIIAIKHNKKSSTSITPSFSDTYLKKAYLQLEKNDESIVFKATVKGKVVLLDSLIFIIPSDRDGRCILSIASDHMKVYMDLYPAQGNGKMAEEEDILGELQKKEVTFGIKHETIKDSIHNVKETGIEAIGTVIAEGRRPKDGTDAKVDFFFSTETTVDDFKILPDGRIDYRKRANIQIVHKGDLLARIGEPTPGVDGADIFGNVIKSKSGDACVLYAGEGVLVENENKEFRAENDGQASLNGTILNVFQHFVVQGDVDYASGNIDFIGNVSIFGSVLPGFEVKADGDVTILKNIEGATVEAGRDARVYGGIVGGDNAIVRCGRNLIANHLQNATVEVQGDIMIRNSCIHSTVYCTGKVSVNEQKGTIIGGIVSGRKGVEAKIIGSPFGTKTEIVVGHDYLVRKKIDEFLAAKSFCELNIQKIEKYLKPLLQMLKKTGTIDTEKQARLKMVMSKRKELFQHKRIMESKLKDLEQIAKSETGGSVKVSGCIYPDVKIIINNALKMVRNKIECSHFILNRKDARIEHTALR